LAWDFPATHAVPQELNASSEEFFAIPAHHALLAIAI